jgi:hypothetical protein
MYKKIKSLAVPLLLLFSIFSFTPLLHANGRTYEWIFMVYMDGDNDLEAALIDDFEEMAEVGSSDTVLVAVLFDGDSDGDSCRGIVNKDDVFEEWKEENIIDEVDMGDTQTLVDFVDWVVNEQSFNASHYALILSDHGDGWREAIERLRNQLRTRSNELSLEEKENILREIRNLREKLRGREHPWKWVCVDDTNGDALDIEEVREALDTLYNSYGVSIDLVGFDACLMGMLEIAYELKERADVMVASEKTEDLEGWPYDDILGAITPGMTPAQLGEVIVQKYEESPSGSNDTLSAVRLQEEINGEMIDKLSGRTGVGAANDIQTLANAVSTFAETVMNEHNAGNDANWDVIFNAQQRAGWYEDYLSYRDLKGFMEEVVAGAANENIADAAQDVIDAFDNCRIAYHTSLADKANGLSIYFPEWYWGDEWWEEDWGYDELIDPDYDDMNLSFVADTSWDEFLDEYVNAYLVPNHSGTAIYSRTIPIGTTASAYVMVSSPVSPGNPDPLAVLRDDLGDYDKEIWRLFRWNPLLESYQEYPFSGDDVVPGKGYWLISSNAQIIDATGQLAETNAPYVIVLYPGWNQIGTPYNFSIDWDTVWVWWFSSSYDFYLYLIFDATASDNVFTSRTLWKYSNGSYSASSAMSPGEGYWIYNYTGGYVYLTVNPVRSTLSEYYRGSLERILTRIGRSERAGTPPPPPIGIDPESDEESGSSGGGTECFIATASFGSPMAAEVDVLRDFRDKYLLRNPVGSAFVSFYYKCSPPVANFIGKHNFLKVAIRSSLYPIVKSCKLTVED